MRKVRNEFAHQWSAKFTTEKIPSWVSSLHLAERYAADIAEPHTARPSPPPRSVLDWSSWVFVHDLADALANPKERFVVELQALAWAMTAADPHPERVAIGRLG